jgi:hypothetical protein
MTGMERIGNREKSCCAPLGTEYARKSRKI